MNAVRTMTASASGNLATLFERLLDLEQRQRTADGRDAEEAGQHHPQRRARATQAHGNGDARDVAEPHRARHNPGNNSRPLSCCTVDELARKRPGPRRLHRKQPNHAWDTDAAYPPRLRDRCARRRAAFNRARATSRIGSAPRSVRTAFTCTIFGQSAPAHGVSVPLMIGATDQETPRLPPDIMKQFRAITATFITPPDDARPEAASGSQAEYERHLVSDCTFTAMLRSFAQFHRAQGHATSRDRFAALPAAARARGEAVGRRRPDHAVQQRGCPPRGRRPDRMLSRAG